jgi:hypothetical protein
MPCDSLRPFQTICFMPFFHNSATPWLSIKIITKRHPLPLLDQGVEVVKFLVSTRVIIVHKQNLRSHPPPLHLIRASGLGVLSLLIFTIAFGLFLERASFFISTNAFGLLPERASFLISTNAFGLLLEKASIFISTNAFGLLLERAPFFIFK